LVVQAQRERLLRIHGHRLRREDLEDCYAQAALELVAQTRKGVRFANPVHIARVLEQRFVSRIKDRRRAIEGRSPAQATFEHALGEGLFGGAEEQVLDRRLETDQLVELRLELRRVADLLLGLTPDQRLVLGSQIYLQLECAEFCARYGWSREKYRKVAQRGRARLRELARADV
jgi:DNA-directed RNA polymerase specialized sigma24 family protein